MPVYDLCKLNLQLKNGICLLAPGPLGAGFYHLIPPEFCVLALNKAILIPGVSIDYWVINHTHQDWFRQADLYWKGPRIYRKESSNINLKQPNPEALWYFYDPLPEKLDIENVELIDDGIRMGGTIAATALQLAWRFGASEIWLCGVDMTGSKYWDGSTNVEHEEFHGDDWMAIPYIEALIKYLEDHKGITIRSLSPTKLNVPMVECSTTK